MRTLLAGQLALYVAFFFVPQALLAAFGEPLSLGWGHVGGLGLFLAVTLAARGDVAPVEPGALLRLSPVARVLVFGSFVLLQLVDFGAVLQGGHQVLYLDARPSSAPAFLPFKLLGSGAVGLAIAALVSARRLRDEPLALAVLASTLGPGTRGLLFFSAIAIVLLRGGWRAMVRPRLLAAGAVALLLLGGVGLLREELDSDLPAYSLLVVSTLNEFVRANVEVGDCGLAPSLVAAQLPGVLLGRLDDARVTQGLTACVSPELLAGGYGIASSALGELTLVLGDAAGWAYALVPLALAAAVALAFRRGGRLGRTVAVAMVPYVLYTVRAELVFPVTYLLKVLIGLHVALGVDALAASLVRQRAPLPER